jgi:integrase
MFKLEWQDVDLTARTITLPALITKTNKPRGVAMTDRVHDELQQLWQASPQHETSRVFGLTDNIKKSWTSACKAACALA